MHLEIEYSELQYIMDIVRVFRNKCKTKSTVIYIIFNDNNTEFVYSSESLFLKYKHQFISPYKGEYSLSIDFIKNILKLFNDGVIEIDFRDKLITAFQNDTLYKGQTCGRVAYDSFKIDRDSLEEIPLKLQLSNKLLNLDLEEMGFENKDPYIHLYNINNNCLIKMSSFCALLQTLEKESPCNVTLTQDILNVCSVVRDNVCYYKYNNSFYIEGDDIEVRLPLANKMFPNLSVIVNKIKQNSQCFLLKSDGLLDICEKACTLNLSKRVDVTFKDGLMIYNHHGVLNGSIESGLELNWKMSFNPFLMRGIIKYINEECITICKSQANSILVYNEDKSIMFILALCQ